MVRPFILLALLATLSAADGDAPPKGVITKEYGTGSGYCTKTSLSVEFDEATSTLSFQVKTNWTCGPYSILETYVFYGDQFDPNPIPLPNPPFAANSILYLIPDAWVGTVDDTNIQISIPNDPTLVGKFFITQAAVVYESASGEKRYALSEAEQLVFY